MRLFAISGSLRRGSYNTALLDAAAAECPTGVEFVIWRGAPKWKVDAYYYGLRAGGWWTWRKYRKAEAHASESL